MSKKLKSSFELAMERLNAGDSKATKSSPLSAKQKEEIGEAKRVAAARLAEREILFRDAMTRLADPAQREQAEDEYRIDRQRIDEDCEKKVEAIRRGRS